MLLHIPQRRRSWRRSWQGSSQALRCALALVSVVGCVDARYGAASDADGSSFVQAEAGIITLVTKPDASSLPPDTGMPPTGDPLGDAGSDEWWAPLRKNYAARMRFFGHDNHTGALATLKHEIIMRAQIQVDGAGAVQLELQRCRDVGTINTTILLTDVFSFSYPERLPVEHHQLLLEQGKVISQAAPRMLGYTDMAPAECTANAQVAHDSSQPWLGSGLCTCGAAELPTFPADCRITDPDQDMQPGLTVVHTGSQPRTVNVRARDSCQIREGTLGADGRLSASYVEDYDYIELGCGETTACESNAIAPCRLDLNPVSFEPIGDVAPSGGDWDCAALLELVDHGQVFPSGMLTFPLADCPAP